MLLRIASVFAAAAGLALLAACATSGSRPALGPVGPAPLAGPSAAGTLLVYSAYSPQAPAPNDPSYRRRHSDYQILDAGGRPLRTVANDAGLAVAAPAPVALPPGAYRVVAAANGYGLVTVPVAVAAGRTTAVHLEGGRDRAAVSAAQAVRLPDGRVVGWSATP